METSPDMRARDAAVLALTLNAEPGLRPVKALEALAALVMNRVRADLSPWGSGVEGVCRAPFQFSCWDLRNARIGPNADVEDLRMAICRRIAARAVAGVLPDPTRGATHYHGDHIQPAWAITHVPIIEISGLLFYCLHSAASPAASMHATLAVCR